MIRKVLTSRRAFLKGAAAALAAPYVVPASAWGAADKPAPSNRITTAHIGIGNQGPGLFGSVLGRDSAQILAVCDVKQQVRDKFQAEVNKKYAKDKESGAYKGCDAYNDYRDVMARGDVDAVVIAVPDHWHAIISIEAAKSGKDIYCEKPLALTVRQARAMASAVRRYGRVLQTGSMQRSMQEFRKGCELVRNGRIGDVKEIFVSGVGAPSSERLFPEEPVPPGFDWGMWLGPAPWAPHNAERCSGNYGGGWRTVRDYSGGFMTDWGAHHFDIAQWGLGMDHTGPVETFAPDPGGFPSLTYKYAGGILMHHYFASTGGPLSRYQLPENKAGVNGVLFVGAKGWVEVNRGYFKCFPESLAQEPIGPSDVQLYKSNDHMGDFLTCIKTRKRPICDVEIGCRSVSVCHIGNITYWLNRGMKWDPVKEEFTGDPEASRWLDRPMRAPWRLG